MPERAIGLLEFGSVARGLEATDAMLKAADVELLLATPICAGKFVTLVGNEVAPVTSAVEAGVATAEGQILDRLILASAHPQLFPALTGTAEPDKVEAVGIVETFTVTSCILGADAAAKAADIRLLTIHVARGLGGKAYFVATGTVSAVEAGVSAALAFLREQGMVVHHTIIPAPHPDLVQALI